MFYYLMPPFSLMKWFWRRLQITMLELNLMYQTVPPTNLAPPPPIPPSTFTPDWQNNLPHTTTTSNHKDQRWHHDPSSNGSTLQWLEQDTAWRLLHEVSARPWLQGWTAYHDFVHCIRLRGHYSRWEFVNQGGIGVLFLLFEWWDSVAAVLFLLRLSTCLCQRLGQRIAKDTARAAIFTMKHHHSVS